MNEIDVHKDISDMISLNELHLLSKNARRHPKVPNKEYEVL